MSVLQRRVACAFYTLPAGHLDGLAACGRRRRADRAGARAGQPRRGYSLGARHRRRDHPRHRDDHACPASGVENYGDEGRDDSWNAVCAGTTANNGLYGEGIVNAIAAVAR